MAITRTELTRSTEHNGGGLSFCVDVALIRTKRNHNGYGKRTGNRRIWYILESGNHTTEMTTKTFTLAPNGKTDFWIDESWNFFGQISVS